MLTSKKRLCSISITLLVISLNVPGSTINALSNSFNEETCEYLNDKGETRSTSNLSEELMNFEDENESILMNENQYASFNSKKYLNFHKGCLKEKHLKLKHSRTNKQSKLLSDEGLTTETMVLKKEIDWSSDNPRIIVKDQGHCGSCWAFATTSAAEVYLANENSKFAESDKHLSPQYLIDCDESNQGCEGGMIDRALEFIDIQGYIYESDYPYKQKDQKCAKIAFDTHKFKGNVEIVNYFKSSEDELIKMLQIGPVVVGISVGTPLYYYSEGTLHNCGTESVIENVNHAVLLVGYGTDSETKQPYWLIQNSWGENWGENGYFRVIRDGKCRCSICSMPSQMKLNKADVAMEDYENSAPEDEVEKSATDEEFKNTEEDMEQKDAVEKNQRSLGSFMESLFLIMFPL
ncbi:MAG: hypothetical protein MHMPM18_000555 [Marteilia pararefringens]